MQHVPEVCLVSWVVYEYCATTVLPSFVTLYTQTHAYAAETLRRLSLSSIVRDAAGSV